jgi:hypothetical protein
MINNFLLEIDNSINYNMCDDIIEKFENNNNLHQDGITMNGINKDIKDTKDFVIPLDNIEWFNIIDKLKEELNTNLKLYIDNYNEKYSINLLDSSGIFTYSFMIQKYEQNIGKYNYHNDFEFDIENKQHRLLTFLWYLNDVLEGGETEFFGKKRITPKKGKLIIFPAHWTFPHCGKTPISSNKYILTGWIYINTIFTGTLY